jgi:hypothetical protein
LLNKFFIRDIQTKYFFSSVLSIYFGFLKIVYFLSKKSVFWSHLKKNQK